MAHYELVAGDGGSTFHATIKDSETEELVDLSGKTVQLRFAINGAPTVLKTMTLLDQVSRKGEATYQFASGDLTAGAMTGEVRLQAGLSDQLTTVDSFYLTIKAPLP